MGVQPAAATPSDQTPQFVTLDRVNVHASPELTGGFVTNALFLTTASASGGVLVSQFSQRINGKLARPNGISWCSVRV